MFLITFLPIFTYYHAVQTISTFFHNCKDKFYDSNFTQIICLFMQFLVIFCANPDCFTC